MRNILIFAGTLFLGAGLSILIRLPQMEIDISEFDRVPAERMIQKNDCEAQKYDIRLECDKNFKSALKGFGITYTAWGIVESNTSFK